MLDQGGLTQMPVGSSTVSASLHTVVTVLLTLGYCWLGPPPTSGTPRWQWIAPPPPALAPLVPAPGRDLNLAPNEQVSRPLR